ncbi:RCC1 and BTB domain-containing protein 1-like [Oppia nitens]|uniref:RCC1 and BTB domain-containing protein 1-like n=1 Tax=Oppia nitens TaxID=1686743 RepID=UPI0023DB6DF5|nr:RCC1 and BTB domain-containing protein 1-like [Oppia nitens]
MANVTNWCVLHRLKPQMVNKIKLCSIFGETSNEVLMITEDDRCWAFGTNRYGCLGLDHNRETPEPQMVNELCHKQVMDIAYGYKHVLALTANGDLYSWGNNTFGQLGNGTNIECFHPTLTGKRIVRISCGANYSQVLTQSGEVFSWGRNNYGQIGNGTHANQMVPIKVPGFDGQKISNVSCGSAHSLALTESGQVYGWGNNAFGQLGIGNNLHRNEPVKVDLKSISIKDMVCGLYHSLLLSITGDIYAFGFNDCGQLGTGNTESVNVAVKVSSQHKFVEIGSEFWCNISTGVTQNGFCYVWGECLNEDTISTPRETPFKTIHDIFAVMSKRKITYKPMNFTKRRERNRVIESLSKSFNDPFNSDLCFKVENKVIYVQKWFVKICCQYFDRMFSTDTKWSESESNEIVIKDYSYSVYYAFLKYIYTDLVEISVDEAIDLLDLADCYLEDELKQKCVQLIKNNLTVNTFCDIYLAAIRYKLIDFDKYCVAFAYNNLFEICKTKSFKTMDNNLCKNLLISVAELA